VTEPRILVGCSNRLGESVTWHRQRSRLLWLDLLDPQLFIHDVLSSKTETHRLSFEAPLGALILTEDPDRVLISHRRGLALYDLRSRTAVAFPDPEAGREDVAYNDGKTDRFGRLWIGSSHLQEKDPRGALWCIESSGKMTLGDAGFVVSNGPAFSPDGRTLYFNDTLGRQTLRYEISVSDARPLRRQLLVSYEEGEGLPDGITVDAEGCFWVAHWGGARVTRFSPGGERLHAVNLPVPNVTSVCFGGPDLKTLFITTAREASADVERYPHAGHLFALESDTRGIPEPEFAVGQAEMYRRRF
jgi:sugar lactone lactonase YvrE